MLDWFNSLKDEMQDWLDEDVYEREEVQTETKEPKNEPLFTRMNPTSNAPLRASGICRVCGGKGWVPTQNPSIGRLLALPVTLEKFLVLCVANIAISKLEYMLNVILAHCGVRF